MNPRLPLDPLRLPAILCLALLSVSVSATAAADGACRALDALVVSAPSGAAYRVTGARTRSAVDLPESCEVTAGTSGTSRMTLDLPATGWNGRLAEVACGTDCPTDAATICTSVISRGYACLRRGATALAGARVTRDAHDALAVAKALAARYYTKPADGALLLACSRGGGEALRRAESDPADFNGMVVGAPVLDERDADARLAWNLSALRTPSGAPRLGTRDLELLHAAALAACDAADGLKDGIIGDPLRCDFDPAVLACSAEHREGCLVPAQLEAARRIYAGPGGSGTSLSLHGGLLPGSELSWRVFLGASGRRHRAAAGSRPGAADSSAAAPDLRRFAAAGGKLLLFQGLADPLVAPRPVVEYYEALMRGFGGLVGSAPVMRFFLVPGMDHCTGGDGAYRIDFLSAMRTWIERGAIRPPDDVIGFHPNAADGLPGSFFAPVARDPAEAAFSGWVLGAGVSLEQSRDQPHSDFSRPVYTYPLRARYKGVGDPASWRSFYAPNDYRLLDDRGSDRP